MLGATVRYGRQPLWAFVWLLGFWIYGVAVFTDAERAGVLKPNKEVVLRSDEWVGCAGDPRGQAACYLATAQGASYPRFNVLAYSADTLLPIVSLEMQEYWIPDDRAGPGGWWRAGLSLGPHRGRVGAEPAGGGGVLGAGEVGLTADRRRSGGARCPARGRGC